MTVGLATAQSTNLEIRATTDATSAVTYRWYYNGTAMVDGGGISGSQGATLVLSGAAVQAGVYACLVENSFGFRTEQPKI